MDSTPEEDTEEIIEEITPCNKIQMKNAKASPNAEYSFCDIKTNEVSSDDFQNEVIKSNRPTLFGPYLRETNANKQDSDK